MPAPFGPTSPTCSPRSIANVTLVSSSLVARGHRQAVDLDDRSAGARRIEEVEAERPTTLREPVERVGLLAALLVEPSDLRQLRLRLPRLALLVAEPFHEALEARDVRLVAREQLAGGERPGRLLPPPLVPRPGEVERAAEVDLEHGRRDGFQEPAIVGDEDHARVDRGQLLLEPLEARHVEVVRRLVEQQQVGIACQRAGERSARELSSGEGSELPVEVDVREAEPAQGRDRSLAPVPAARVLEPRLGVRVARERRRVVRSFCHRLLERTQLLLERDEIRCAREDVFTKREVALERRPLVVQRDARALRERELAAVHLRLTGEHAEQRRLAGAVRPGEGESVAALDLERHAVEERRAAQLFA